MMYCELRYASNIVIRQSSFIIELLSTQKRDLVFQEGPQILEPGLLHIRSKLYLPHLNREIFSVMVAKDFYFFPSLLLRWFGQNLANSFSNLSCSCMMFFDSILCLSFFQLKLAWRLWPSSICVRCSSSCCFFFGIFKQICVNCKFFSQHLVVIWQSINYCHLFVIEVEFRRVMAVSEFVRLLFGWFP